MNYIFATRALHSVDFPEKLIEAYDEKDANDLLFELFDGNVSTFTSEINDKKVIWIQKKIGTACSTEKMKETFAFLQVLGDYLTEHFDLAFRIANLSRDYHGTFNNKESGCESSSEEEKDR